MAERPEETSALPGVELDRFLPALQADWLATRSDEPWRSLDASLVFADVSGFTALSERLARRGRVGAEDLSEAINTVFARLIACIHELGGDVLKFGGDALLLLFDGPDHVQRACAAGLGIQAQMRLLRRERAVTGAAGLRVSIGIASGTAHLFLAGRAHRELIVAGPLASEVVTLEAAADAGEVLVSRRFAAELGDRIIAESSGPGALLRSASEPAACDPPSWPRGIDPRLGLPQHLRDHRPGEAEHRSVTIAFLQFRGIDGLLAEQGPEVVAAALDDLIGAVQEACLAYGVTFVATDVDRDAGKVLMVAGAPTASPDDDDRMLHALRAVVEQGWKLDVRAGVNRGRGFVVDIGTPERRNWTVMGDATNLAARVMGHAPDGEVLAAESALEGLRDDFRRTPIPPFTVKGKSGEVRAEIVGQARGRRRTDVKRDTRLVGRETELEVMREALAAARAGKAATVELIGEAGIGKSALVQALLAEVHDEEVTNVQAGPYAAFSPFRAVQAPLRSLLVGEVTGEQQAADILARRVAETAPGLEPLLPLIGIPLGLEFAATPQSIHLDPKFAAAAINDAVGRLVEAALPARPWILVVEDAHWLDGASTELIAHVIRRTEGRGRMALISRRDDPGPPSDVDEWHETILLGPLPVDAARALVTIDEDLTLSPKEVAALIDRAAGNPLFLEELLTAARAGETVEALPETVETLIAARIDTLPGVDRAVLRKAAVLGVQITTDLLVELLEWDPVSARAGLGRLSDFLVPEKEDAVRFRHALLRDAAYESLPFRQRRELHARAAQIIEGRPDTPSVAKAEMLSLHYHAARRWLESWRWSRAAGEQAARHGAPGEAVRFFEHALEAGRQNGETGDEELGRVAEQLGDAASLAARYDVAAAAFREARVRGASDPLRVAELCRKEGRLRERSSRYSAALRWYTRGLKLLDDARRSDRERAAALHARLLVAQGAARLRQGRLLASLPLLEAGAAAAEKASERPTLAHAYYLLDWAHSDLGNPEVLRYRSLAFPIYQELEDFGGQARVLNNLGIDAYYEGRWDEAVAYYERSRRASEQVGDIVEVATAQNNIAEILSDQGRLDEAEELLKEALATWRAAGFPVGIGLALSNLGRVAARRHELDRAAGLLGKARDQLDRIGAVALVLELDAREAERLLFAGDRDAAMPLLGDVRKRARDLGAAPTLLSMLQRLAGHAKLQGGEPSEAADRFREAIEFARSVNARYEEALAQEGLAETGDPEAETLRSTARETFERLGVVAQPTIPWGR